MPLYISKRFKPYELVDKLTYESYADKCLNDIYDLFDFRLLEFYDNLMDKLEEHYNKKLKIVCNNWLWHKKPNAPDYFQFRGLRTIKSKDYNPGSNHTYIANVRKVRALDVDIVGLTAEEVRKFIIEHQDEEWCKKLGGLETGVNWLHGDVRDRLKGKIILFGKPNKK